MVKSKTNPVPSKAALTAVRTAQEQSAVGGMVWKALSMGATLLATKAATTIATKGWRAATGRPVPVKSDYGKNTNKDVVIYTALSAALMAGAKAALERKAADYFRDSTGHLPAALTTPSVSKKELKAAKKYLKANDDDLAEAEENATS